MVTQKNQSSLSNWERKKKKLQRHYAGHWTLLSYLETGEQVAGQHPDCNILSRKHQSQKPPSQIHISCFFSSLATCHPEHLEEALAKHWKTHCQQLASILHGGERPAKCLGTTKLAHLLYSVQRSPELLLQLPALVTRSWCRSKQRPWPALSRKSGCTTSD